MEGVTPYPGGPIKKRLQFEAGLSSVGVFFDNRVELIPGHFLVGKAQVFDEIMERFRAGDVFAFVLVAS